MNANRFFGGSVRVGPSASNYSVADKALVVINPTAPGVRAILIDPVSRGLKTGFAHYVIANENPTNIVSVYDYTNTTLLGNIQPQTTVAICYVGAVTASGWLLYTINSGIPTAVGVPVSGASLTFNLEVTRDTHQFNLRQSLLARGWDGVTAVDASVRVAPGIAVYSRSTQIPAFTTGPSWPALSNFSLINDGIIVGMGGKGGNGAITQLAGSAGPGSRGGTALEILLPTVLVNGGFIAGGGGGGSGGVAPLVLPVNDGGGGGGGCPGGRGGFSAAPAEPGGNSELFTEVGRIPTLGLNISWSGAGGRNGEGSSVVGMGGAGGLPGNDGIGTGAVGGLSGYWLERPTAISLTIVSAGGSTAGPSLVY